MRPRVGFRLPDHVGTEGHGESAETPKTTITWKPSGPLIVEGPVEIRDNSGHPLELPPSKIPGQVKLCACGLSKTRPFCDGSHRR